MASAPPKGWLAMMMAPVPGGIFWMVWGMFLASMRMLSISRVLAKMLCVLASEASVMVWRISVMPSIFSSRVRIVLRRPLPSSAGMACARLMNWLSFFGLFKVVSGCGCALVGFFSEEGVSWFGFGDEGCAEVGWLWWFLE